MVVRRLQPNDDNNNTTLLRYQVFENSGLVLISGLGKTTTNTARRSRPSDMSGKSGMTGGGGGAGGRGGSGRRKGSGEGGGGTSRTSLSVTQLRELVESKLVATGQRDVLKRVMSSLLAETNWPDELRAQCINSIKAHHKSSLSTPFNVSHMVADVSEVGRASFPPSVRAKMHSLLFRFAQSFITVDDSLAIHPEDEGIEDNGDISRGSSSREPPLSLLYQSKDAIPDPGLGVNVSDIDTGLIDRRRLRLPSPHEDDEDEEEEEEEEEEELQLPPPLLPVLRPESELVMTSGVKDDVRLDEDEDDDEAMTKEEDDEDEEAQPSGGDEDEDDDDDEEEEDDQLQEEDEEEELMDV